MAELLRKELGDGILILLNCELQFKKYMVNRWLVI